ncbi:MAG: M48 family metalloprotease [Armatimonadota bacterium]
MITEQRHAIPRFLHWMLLGVLIAVLPFVLGSGGCSPQSLLVVDDSTEIELGKEAAAQFEQQHHVITGTADADRVLRIGRKIAAATNRLNLPWTFKVVDDPTVNAFSLPGGPVYVHSGMLNLGISDAELAGVLGHEAAHINQRHSAKAIQHAMEIALVSDIALRNQSDATRAAVNMALTLGVDLPHSRKDEYEADAIGIRIPYNAGYPADSIVAFLKRLDTLPDQP